MGISGFSEDELGKERGREGGGRKQERREKYMRSQQRFGSSCHPFEFSTFSLVLCPASLKSR